METEPLLQKSDTSRCHMTCLGAVKEPFFPKAWPLQTFPPSLLSFLAALSCRTVLSMPSTVDNRCYKKKAQQDILISAPKALGKDFFAT